MIDNWKDAERVLAEIRAFYLRTIDEACHRFGNYQKLAKGIGVSKSYLSRLLHGSQTFSGLRTVVKKILGITEY